METLTESLSSRRAWIEIGRLRRRVDAGMRRSPHGERGLKFVMLWMIDVIHSRSPHGERGLKLVKLVDRLVCSQVALLTESVD